jgi:hypothetical protein
VAARSNTWVCGLSLAEIVGPNPVGDMDVSILRILRVVRQKRPCPTRGFRTMGRGGRKIDINNRIYILALLHIFQSTLLYNKIVG